MGVATLPAAHLLRRILRWSRRRADAKASIVCRGVNALDGDIVHLFRVLQDPTTRAGLTEHLVLTPYSREEFELSWEPSTEPIERARRTIIRAQMGFG